MPSEPSPHPVPSSDKGGTNPTHHRLAHQRHFAEALFDVEVIRCKHLHRQPSVLGSQRQECDRRRRKVSLVMKHLAKHWGHKVVAVSVLMLACASFHVRGCLCSSVHYLLGFASYFHTGSGSHVHFRPRPSSSTDRWARLTSHRHVGPHNTVKSVLSCPPRPHRHRMCVIAKGLGCLRWLAHAAEDGHRLNVNAHRSALLVVFSPWIPKLAIISVLTHLSQTCAF